MKNLLAWIIVICSVLMLVPSGILIYINGWLNGLGFMFVMAIPPLLVGLLLFRNPFPRNITIIAVLLSLLIGGIFTWLARKNNTLKPSSDNQLGKEVQTIKDSIAQ